MLYGSLGCNKRGVGWNGCGGVVVSVVWGVAVGCGGECAVMRCGGGVWCGGVVVSVRS